MAGNSAVDYLHHDIMM